MADAAQLWKQALPEVRQAVTGVGVWAALNAVVPILIEDGTFFVGFNPRDSELAGHLKLPATKRLMETVMTRLAVGPINVRVIEGTTQADIDLTKRRDVERRRMQEAEMAKLRTEMNARTSWDSVYEQLSRRFAAIPNKSLPQNRARFLAEAVELIAEARKGQANFDDMGERNFARSLERLSQYTELPSTLIASLVMERAGEL